MKDNGNECDYDDDDDDDDGYGYETTFGFAAGLKSQKGISGEKNCIHLLIEPREWERIGKIFAKFIQY